jgi:4-amino-4-deoxy-L-arabinose transferase-like glycosyltransferase
MLLALFSIAFGLRILYAAVIGTNPGVNPSPGTYDYYLAQRMHDNTAWVTEPFTPNAPGYPVLLAAAFRVLGVRRWVVILMQAFLGAVTALFLYRIGERTLGHGVGLLSALWLALSVHQMHFASVFVRDTAVTFALVWFVHTAVRRFVKMRQAVWAGMVYTLLIHFDAQFLLLLPVVLVYFVFFATQHRILNVQYVFLFLATVMVVSLPWTIRNTLVYGEIIPIGLEAQHYTEPLTGWISPNDGGVDGGERVMHAHPDGFVANTVEFWRVTRFGAEDGGGAVKAEPPWSLRHNLVNIVSFGVLLPFAVAGLVMAWHRRNRAVLLLLLVILTHWIAHAVLGATDRDRLVIEPLVILIAMYGLVEVVRAARSGEEPASAAVGA